MRSAAVCLWWLSCASAWRPANRAALDAALADWLADKAASESSHGPIGTWDVSQIKEFYGSTEG
eukprot:5015814-Prymnesium_polylepis.1